MARKAPLQVAREEATIRRDVLRVRSAPGLEKQRETAIEALVEEAALGFVLFQCMDGPGLRHVLEVQLREFQAAGEPAPAWLRQACLAFDVYATTSACIRSRGGWDAQKGVGDG